MHQMIWTSAAPAVTTAFLSSLVEAVEALTIVLAVVSVRGWRPAAIGALAGLGLLVIIVLALGPLLDRIPLHLLQLVIGVLLLLFGMRWLRKAILRAAGVIALHDEAIAFATETEELRDQARRTKRDSIGWPGLRASRRWCSKGWRSCSSSSPLERDEVSLGLRALALSRPAWSWSRSALSYIVRSSGCPKTRSSLLSESCFPRSGYFGREKDSASRGRARTLLS